MSRLASSRPGGERRHPDRPAEHRPQRVERAVMVLMGVGDDHALHRIAKFGHDERMSGSTRSTPGRSGPGKVTPQSTMIHSRRSGRTVAVKGEIHADFADAAKRGENEFVVGHPPIMPRFKTGLRKNMSAGRDCTVLPSSSVRSRIAVRRQDPRTVPVSCRPGMLARRCARRCRSPRASHACRIAAKPAPRFHTAR